MPKKKEPAKGAPTSAKKNATEMQASAEAFELYTKSCGRTMEEPVRMRDLKQLIADGILTTASI